jgi:hypothetical protein
VIGDNRFAAILRFAQDDKRVFAFFVILSRRASRAVSKDLARHSSAA